MAFGVAFGLRASACTAATSVRTWAKQMGAPGCSGTEHARRVSAWATGVVATGAVATGAVWPAAGATACAVAGIPTANAAAAASASNLGRGIFNVPSVRDVGQGADTPLDDRVVAGVRGVANHAPQVMGPVSRSPPKPARGGSERTPLGRTRTGISGLMPAASVAQ
ncbi:hypothetical protein GCM10009839_52020 [Catenulispora yoronensis]|uniref:Uncharacterized protein n=1 Tax=Catenulispora yoronensis TaxID=450799 RepID=A0ABP5G9W0_9ACTN